MGSLASLLSNGDDGSDNGDDGGDDRDGDDGATDSGSDDDGRTLSGHPEMMPTPPIQALCSTQFLGYK